MQDTFLHIAFLHSSAKLGNDWRLISWSGPGGGSGELKKAFKPFNVF